MAEITQMLRAAKKYIDDHNYKEALRVCDAICGKNKRNYMCWVYIGKALDITEEAKIALQIAITIDPKKPLAWRGLANYFEHLDDTKAKLPLFTIYNQLIPLETGKEGKLISKISQLGKSLKSQLGLKLVLRHLDSKPSPEIYRPCIHEIPNLLLSDIAYAPKHLIKAARYYVREIFKEPEHTIYPMLTQSMINKNINVFVVEEAICLMYLNAYVPFRQWMCQWLCGYFAMNETFSGMPVESNGTELTIGFPTARCSILLNSMIAYSKGLYNLASLRVTPLAFAERIPCVEGIFMIKCNVKLGRWIVVERTSSEFAVGSDDVLYLQALEKYKFFALVQQKKWELAIKVGRRIPAHLLNTSEKALLAKCYIENNEGEPEDLMEILFSTVCYQQLKGLTLIVQKDYRRAISLLKRTGSNAGYFFYIARSYWELEENNDCEKYLWKSLRLDSTIFDAHYYMGMFHHFRKKDLSTAIQHYENAFRLNSSNKTLVKYMSDIYLELDQKCKHLCLLSTHSIFFPEEDWLHFRLGQLYMAVKDTQSACKSFRRHLYVNEDAVAHICLAEAYYANDAPMHAIQSYEKAMTMDETQKTFCLTRIGYIYFSTEQYTKAITVFKIVFERDPNYTLAFKGAAESWMRSAQAMASIGYSLVARDGLQVAVDYLLRGLHLTNTILVFWKLLGRAFQALSSLPPGHGFVEVCLDNPDDMLNVGTVYLRSSLEKLIEYCFWRAHCDPTVFMRKRRAEDLSREIIIEERFAHAFRVVRHSPPPEYTEFLYQLRHRFTTPQNNNS